MKQRIIDAIEATNTTKALAPAVVIGESEVSVGKSPVRDHCPFCKSTEIRVVSSEELVQQFAKHEDEIRKVAEGGYSFFACTECEKRWVVARMSAEKYAAMVKDQEGQKMKARGANRKARRRAFAKARVRGVS